MNGLERQVVSQTLKQLPEGMAQGWERINLKKGETVVGLMEKAEKKERSGSLRRKAMYAMAIFLMVCTAFIIKGGDQESSYVVVKIMSISLLCILFMFFVCWVLNREIYDIENSDVDQKLRQFILDTAVLSTDGKFGKNITTAILVGKAIKVLMAEDQFSRTLGMMAVGVTPEKIIVISSEVIQARGNYNRLLDAHIRFANFYGFRSAEIFAEAQKQLGERN